MWCYIYISFYTKYKTICSWYSFIEYAVIINSLVSETCTCVSFNKNRTILVNRHNPFVICRIQVANLTVQFELISIYCGIISNGDHGLFMFKLPRQPWFRFYTWMKSRRKKMSYSFILDIIMIYRLSFIDCLIFFSSWTYNNGKRPMHFARWWWCYRTLTYSKKKWEKSLDYYLAYYYYSSNRPVHKKYNKIGLRSNLYKKRIPDLE